MAWRLWTAPDLRPRFGRRILASTMSAYSLLALTRAISVLGVRFGITIPISMTVFSVLDMLVVGLVGAAMLLALMEDERTAAIEELAATERERAAVRDEAQPLMVAVNNAADGIVVAELDGTLRHFNDAFSEAALAATGVQPVLGGPSTPFRNPDDDSFWSAVFATVKRGETFSEERAFHVGRFHGIVEIRAAPWRRGGVIAGAVMFVRNFSDARARDAELQHALQLQSVSRLAGGVAHDFNNLLTTILGNVGLLRAAPEFGSESRLIVDDVLDATQRARVLVTQLMAFARQQTGALVPTDVYGRLAALEPRLRRAAGPAITLMIEAPDTPWRVLVEPAPLDQVILQLVQNAVDAMPRGGALGVRVEHERIGNGGPVAPGDWVRLVVTDTGVGMDAETQARIFEPFFTTHSRAERSGLGLAASYGTVQRAGGRIVVRSEVGRGTTMQVFLPRHLGEGHRATPAEPMTPPASAGPAEPVTARAETILLVEDDPAVRKITARIIRALGYELLVADGPTAARVHIAAGERIDLLLTDLSMPGTDGATLAEEIAASRPGLRVIFMSGYSEAPPEHLTQPTRFFLAKPFRRDELSTLLRRAFDARS
ncbi:MAG: response regulator [Gemmatimonadaceae bacterium]|nr:response regulator [Gemmatimonadaceae bacterium]